MQRSSGTRLLPLFITLIVIALVIAAVISIGRAVFNSGSDTDSEDTSQTDIGRESLLKTDQDRSVRMTVRGPIVAEEDFKSYQVTVSPAGRIMTVHKGYLQERTGGTELGNNTQAYEQFVFALDKAEMMKGKESTAEEDTDDVRGICATGYVYEFAVRASEQDVKRLWTSTCEGSKGSLDASKDQLSNLFLAQIPNSKTLLPFKQSGLRLNF